MSSAVELTNYDNIADTYLRQIANPLSFNNLYERPYMLSQFDNFRNKDVLDAGCGSGFYSFYAQDQEATVTAVDASQKLLNYIKQNDRKKNITVIQADLAKGLPFIKNNSQDYIICSLMIHYIENWELVINEFYRILRKGGKAYISTHHPFIDYMHLHKSSYFDKYLAEDMWGEKEYRYKVHYYTRSLTDLLKPFLQSDFKILNIEEPLPTPECRKLDPATYQRLMEKPVFIFITLEK